jgi:hypothetical protein
MGNLKYGYVETIDAYDVRDNASEFHQALAHDIIVCELLIQRRKENKIMNEMLCRKIEEAK